ncbi:hypothetical protein KIN20_001640 [Parelaphostrongylus tenuis]|uniref:Apple domain-containing protein n=1 Tax=Parelaphostrongylus tenuis TaxID=148309 RepID=A0AAD5LYM1_PARTN|nr:hypothetical protein KIN20_001640 [Parelaphostrongylus tenuis]
MFRRTAKYPDPMAMETVEFKDDCLRACLRSQIRGKPCASLEHRPKDNACVLSEKIGKRRTESTRKKGNYFENVCARPQEGGRLVARLAGFQGGEGVLELAQRKRQNPKLLAIMTGLQENQDFHIFYAPDVELSSCHKINHLKDNLGKMLVTVDSDSRGMAVQPWTGLDDFHILSDDVIGKVVVVVDANTSNVVDCGELKIYGNTSDWYHALNGSDSVVGVIGIFLIAVLILG